MRIIGNDPSVPRQTQEVASGTLPNGKPVVVNADGTVSVVDPTSGTIPSSTPVLGNAVVFREGDTDDITSVYDTNSNKLVVAYIESTFDATGKAIVGTVSGGSITFGTPVTFESGGNIGGDVKMVFDSSNNKVVISYRGPGSNLYGTSVVGTVSGTSISFGTPVVFESSRTEYIAPTFDTTNNKVVICFQDSGGDGYGIVGTVSGTSISFGSKSSAFETGTFAYSGATFDSNAGKVVCAYQDFAGATAYAIVGTVSGTSISFGSKTQIESGRRDTFALGFDTSTNKVLITWKDDSGGGTQGYGQLAVGTVSGTSISLGSTVNFHAGTTYQRSVSFDPVSNKLVLSYRDGGDSNKMKYVLVTISGTSATISSETASALPDSRAVSAVYDPDSASHLVSFTNSSTVYGTTQIVTTTSTGTNLTSENYIGMSRGPITINSRTQAVGTAVQYESGNAPQSNIVFDSTNNKIVITFRDVNNSNYATAIVGTVNASDNSISFGTPTVYSSNSTAENKPTFDSNAGKVVIAYYDGGNTNYGTAVVGTVSGTSISFGTPVVYNSGNATVSNGIAFDSNSNRVVISYKDQAQSDHGKAIVGSVSGTSISFGTEVTFRSQRVDDTSMTFDSTNNKIVISWSDDFHNDAGGGGGYGNAIVGTVDPSDNSISFGSKVVFASHRVAAPQIGFDPVAGKVVIAHEENGTALRAIVGTVSGTSISFGTAVQYSTATDQSLTHNAVAFDSSAGKIAIVFKDETNSVGKLIAGTVSGTSITFDDEITLFNSSVQYFAVAYDSNSERLVAQVRDTVPDGKAIVVALGFTNITRGQVADGGHALIDTQGAISDNQSGLTAGQSYFVQTDGTIGTTAADPSVFAGTAVSATKLIVKG